jgi:hypothetical protein
MDKYKLIFDANPTVAIIYESGDGNCFLSKLHASNHAGSDFKAIRKGDVIKAEKPVVVKDEPVQEKDMEVKSSNKKNKNKNNR